MKKISKTKVEKAKQLISALQEQYRASSYKLSEEKIQMVRDGAFRKSLPLVDDEVLMAGRTESSHLNDNGKLQEETCFWPIEWQFGGGKEPFAKKG